MMRLLVKLLLLIALTVDIGCVGNSGPSNIAEVEEFPPEPEIILTREALIGNGDEGFRLGTFGGVAVGHGGIIFVADGASKTIWVVGSEYGLKDKIGKQGEGPGEFIFLTDIALGPDDSLYTFDLTLRRVMVFAPPRFVYERSFPIQQESTVGDLTRVRYPLAIRSAMENILLVEYQDFSFFESNDVSRSIVSHNLNGTPINDTLLILRNEGFEGSRESSDADINYTCFPPFGRKDIMGVASDGSIYKGWSETLDIDVVATNGASADHIAFEPPTIAISDEELKEAIESIDLQDCRAAIREGDHHDTKPAFNAIVVDDEDRVWVQLSWPYGAEEVAWLVFERSGELVGHAMVPADVMLHVVKAGKAYGVRTSEMGEQEVVVYRVEMPSADVAD